MLKFPHFKLNKAWKKSLYVDTPASSLVEVPSPQPAVQAHPSLRGLNIGLSWDSNVTIDAPSLGWKLNIKAPSFNFTPHKLLKGPGLQLLRGDDGEIGLSFDANSSRHFYFIANALANPKFIIQFKVFMVYFSDIFHLLIFTKGEGCSLVFNKDKAIVGVLDKSGKLHLVYSAPVVRLPNKKTVTPDVSWDFMSSKLTVTLPELSFPMVLAFGLGTKIPEAKGFSFAFPSFSFGSKGEVESSSDSEEENFETPKVGGGINLNISLPKFGFGGKGEKSTEASTPGVKVQIRFWFTIFIISNALFLQLPSFALKFPNFKLGKSWSKSLYGSLDTPRVELPHGQLSAHSHPSLNGINVSLSLDGAVSFDSPDWKFGVAPLHFGLSAPKLYHGDGLHLVRGDDGEIGISFDKNASRHFFFLGKAPSSPKFSLGLKVFRFFRRVCLSANISTA